MPRACAIMSLVACPVVPHFATYLINSKFSLKKVDIKCVFKFSLQLISETFLVIRSIWRDVIRNVNRSSFKVPFFLTYYNKNGIFSTNFEKTEISYFLKNPFIRSRVVPFGRTDRRTERKTARRTDRQRGGQKDRRMDGRTDRQTDRRTDGQTDRRIDRRTD